MSISNIAVIKYLFEYSVACSSLNIIGKGAFNIRPTGILRRYSVLESST